MISKLEMIELIDTIRIDLAENKAHIQCLEKMVLQLAKWQLSEKQAKQLESHFLIDFAETVSNEFDYLQQFVAKTYLSKVQVIDLISERLQKLEE